MSSITYSGKDFSDSDINFVMSRDSFAQAPIMRSNEFEITGGNGSVFSDNQISAMELTVNGIIEGTSFDDKIAKYRVMIGYLTSVSNQDLIYSNDSGVAYPSILSDITKENLSANVYSFEMTFICPQGFGQDITSTSDVGTTSVVSDLTSDGNYFVYPTIRLTNMNNGPIDVTVSNPTTGDTLSFTGLLTNAGVLNIETIPGGKRAYENTENRLIYLDEGSNFPYLVGGFSNTINVTVSAGSVTTTVTYKKSYI